MNSNTTAVSVHTLTGKKMEARLDFVAVEEPLEIQVNGFSLGITMRTPGDDEDLARGLLFNEGVIDDAGHIASMEYKSADGNSTGGTTLLSIQLAPGRDPDFEQLRRSTYANSSCGVCGRMSIDSIQPRLPLHLAAEVPEVRSETIYEMPETLRRHQEVFERTGGLHAAALFSAGGQLRGVREDVGRHNAVDKIIGASLLGQPDGRTESILFVSGRAGFELVQKAVAAGIPIMAAVGAPSSLAVETARRHGMTLVGFVRENRFNLYSGAGRLR